MIGLSLRVCSTRPPINLTLWHLGSLCKAQLRGLVPARHAMQTQLALLAYGTASRFLF